MARIPCAIGESVILGQGHGHPASWNLGSSTMPAAVVGTQSVGNNAAPVTGSVMVCSEKKSVSVDVLLVSNFWHYDSTGCNPTAKTFRTEKVVAMLGSTNYGKSLDGEAPRGFSRDARAFAETACSSARSVTDPVTDVVTSPTDWVPTPSPASLALTPV